MQARTVDAAHLLRLWRLQRDVGRHPGAALTAMVRGESRTLLSATMAEFVPLPVRREVFRAVDVGGHLGDWTAGILALYPKAEVTVFEPTPTSAAALRRRLGSSATVVEAAVGAQCGSTRLFHFDGATDLNSLHQPADGIRTAVGLERAAEVAAYEVPVTTLDEAVAPGCIDLIKIDVQGAEADVIRGGQRVLSEARCVVVETAFSPQYVGGATFSQVLPLLADVGLRLHSFTHLHHDADGVLLWSDAVFLRPSKASAADDLDGP